MRVTVPPGKLKHPSFLTAPFPLKKKQKQKQKQTNYESPPLSAVTFP